MPACTYMSDNELATMTEVEDRDFNELFQEIRQLIPDKYFINSRMILHKRNWWKGGPQEFSMSYSMYIKIGNGPECQCFNFPPKINGSSLNFSGDRGSIMSFFFGILAGIQHSNKLITH